MQAAWNGIRPRDYLVEQGLRVFINIDPRCAGMSAKDTVGPSAVFTPRKELASTVKPARWQGLAIDFVP